MAVFLILSVVVPLLVGGTVWEPRLFLIAPFSDPRPLDPASLPTVLFSFPWWVWLVPFPAATAFYLWTSALFTATKHPGRWVVGMILGLSLVSITVEQWNLVWLSDATDPLLSGFFKGRYGLMNLLTGGTAAAAYGVDLPNGESLPMFVGMPTMGRWLVGSALWIGAGLAALGLASLRHRDGVGFRRAD
jgi:hypothetical protein